LEEIKTGVCVEETTRKLSQKTFLSGEQKDGTNYISKSPVEDTTLEFQVDSAAKSPSVADTDAKFTLEPEDLETKLDSQVTGSNSATFSDVRPPLEEIRGTGDNNVNPLKSMLDKMDTRDFHAMLDNFDEKKLQELVGLYQGDSSITSDISAEDTTSKSQVDFDAKSPTDSADNLPGDTPAEDTT